MVEGNLGNGTVGIHIPVQVGFCHILQRVFVGLLLQQIGLVGNFKHKVGLLSRMVFAFLYYCIQLYF
jgi:hypothetical protein